MKLSSLICQDCSKAAVLFNSKKRILEFISELAHNKLPYLAQQDILNALTAREKLGSTGIGRGIAIPHGRMSGVQEPLALILVSEAAINFDAIDNRPVDIFVALIVPDGDNKQHLKTLATIAEKLNDKEFCKQLRAAKSDSELYQIIVSQP
ncbi:sugar-specific enzyme IIA component of PTS [Pseudoalteromonas sp. 3J6]|jgi:PTS system nitrogen regulatory IIA component|uniref:PTS IIA-like nitrogen regulatory protein PtsN n=1 Tax=unclassified Pseudoalteromonas TaxID=194690 RepID=UPI00110AF0D8|nr:MULTISPECIES: PTS IIA-like nitrogen regulatory protein PtsN [unclassified Pseudoalteromonas]MDN3484945.1 PTS IIA-like nitrogen regulatory protein PtsN [Pseudoalteromonas sp. APC 3224]TMP67713.1 PTS IIA-like nitrogen-regulatory protein PtsN [Pseudoalteromonas sp. S1609]CAD2223354.1 sugar-specific enzyme IIA component of PTS [Pseudoalteromonas sp. 3J6]